ncbi:hypothetical protein LSCM1_04031 [Leishmania martiniquensis]|uniref:Uncharacterized protein n=1 Tax=Leishmania martiniquensis TaxID=1580590 RepID=A0A836KHM6_9TRYP|nr:hypothetical protein LSCM1_04031 [Leishmania martiniquensis]
MDTSASNAHADQLSVVYLRHLHEGVLQLREHLRCALLADSPQTEMIVYVSLYRLYRDFYLPFYYSKAHIPSSLPPGAGAAPLPDERTAASPEMWFVLTTYTQDVLAACLYLLDPASLPTTYIVPPTPPACEAAVNDSNASNFYVSAEQRRFCGLVFLYTCWSPATLPLHVILQALYPLLDPGLPGPLSVTGSTLSATADQPGATEPSPVAENHIAADLFAQKRFASRKQLLRGTLTGLVLTRPNGVRALLRILLLNDKVEADMTGEAAHLLVQLLTSPVSRLWWRQQQPGEPVGHRNLSSVSGKEDGAETVIVVRVATALSAEEHARLLAPHLLALLQEHAGATAGAPSTSAGAAATAQPRFLSLVGAANLRLPAETVEQRLHLGLTKLINALVRLPPRSSHDFPRFYRQFFYTNKYVLSPGFGCLSLRSDTLVEEKDVIAALARLSTLLKGVSLGAGTDAAALVLSATAAGLLSLCALFSGRLLGESDAVRFVSPLLPASLRILLTEMLSNPSIYDVCGRALVMACGEARPHCYLPGTLLQPHLRYTRDVCRRERLAAGLEWLLLDVAATTPGFVHACVDAAVETCLLELFASGVDHLALPPAPRLTEMTCLSVATPSLISAPPVEADTAPLVAVLERLSFEAAPEALFGSYSASLASTLELLGRILRLSGALYRWALGLMENMLSAGCIEVHLGAGDSVAERRLRLSRLKQCSRTILASLTLSDTPAEGTEAWASMVTGDDALLSLTVRVRQALETCLERIEERLASLELEEQLSHDQSHRQSEVITVVRVEWYQLAEKLRAALDTRSAVDVAVLLATLARRVDDVIVDVTNPHALYTTTQTLLVLLVRVLFETDDVGAALRAVHCVTWLGMYRFDSKDSSYMADLLWSVLAEDHLPPWLASSTGGKAVTEAAAVSRRCRLRVRVLDILLSWTDYDEDDRTLRNLDDSYRRRHHTSLYDVLVALCHSTQDALVQVAALHFIGSYALAMYPRVPVSAIFDLCRDVFRLSPHEMAKAACAAALGKVVAALCKPSGANLLVLSEVDIGTLQSLASAMASYRGRPLTSSHANVSAPSINEAAMVDLHDAVIQQHGRDMLALLRTVSLGRGGAAPAMTG